MFGVSMPQSGMVSLLEYLFSLMAVTDSEPSPAPQDWLKEKDTDLIMALVVLAHM
jgi:hypothetical protein